ncbi:efflux transporter, outer membrane factor lipoprotein, NodT family [Pseudomonas sp. M47T1]|uniref:efflux transporter outer membrane subunit n=1 Tax=unclassified Pseudomonas TaxID=196821 RepID=UPI0002607262|nr:efflux transporter outer membrane subunit [Pseudomonas sp. M47T1]EIK96643.1 efflux transporter, outer membrane factor lipoprotein, NodT family [Pseudomonas sp. M47T1]
MNAFLPSRLCVAVLLASSLLGGCMVGPDYKKPTAPMSTTFKEADGWKAASPQDELPKGPWWALYEDPQLNALAGQVQLNNQNVAVYAAQYRQALALVRESRADLFPTLTGTASSTRSETGTGSSSSSSSSSSAGAPQNEHSASLSLSWEADIWGKLRRTVEENRASAQASAADLANATLSAQSTLAQDYFQLRILDQRIALYRETIKGYERYLRVIQNKYDEQISSRADLATGKTQLQSAQASMLDLQWQRAQYEHAIALLIGKPPADFALAVDEGWQYHVPSVPLGLPSRLLERRPDIAAAERDMAAANAAVGVATAAYYPDLTLSASGGYQGSTISNLFSVPNRFWSIGPSLTGTIFDFGATKAAVEQARFAYDAKVATYRQTVLTGLGEVEDYLVELRTLEPELVARRNSAQSAEESASVSRDQYEAGVIDYLDVATTQATSLSERQTLLSLVATQLVTSVQLQAALGGSWTGE